MNIKNIFKERSLLDVISIMLKLFFMFLRGIPYYFLFKKCGGIILKGKGVKIYNPWYIITKGTIVLEDYSEIQGLSKKYVTLGKKFVLGKYSCIRPSGYYGREIGEGLLVGDNTSFGPFCYIGCSGFVKIGNNVMFSPRVSIYAENHNFDNIDQIIKEQGVTRGEVIIGDNCWIASNSIILNNVELGNNCVVGAGSVVTKSFTENSVIIGSPAKLLRLRGQK